MVYILAIVPTDAMKIKTDKLPENYEHLLENEGLSKQDIKSNIEKYKTILQGYKNSYYPYECNATYKGYIKFYIDYIRAKVLSQFLSLQLQDYILKTEKSRLFLETMVVKMILVLSHTFVH